MAEKYLKESGYSFTEVEGLVESLGVSSAGKIPALNSKGRLDKSLVGTKNTYRLSSQGGSFETLSEAFTYFSTLTQTEGIRLIIDGGSFEVNDTLLVSFTFPLYIEGTGSNSTILTVGTGLANKPMFDVDSDVYITKVKFDGSTFPNWWLSDSAAFIYLVHDNLYCEVTDFIMYQAAEGICSKSNSDFFVYNFIIEKMRKYGVGINNNVLLSTGGSLDVEIGNFVDCTKSISLQQGISVDVYLQSLRFKQTALQTSIFYNPTLFSYNNFSINGNEFSLLGTNLSGFDFTLGRDANIEVFNNVRELNRNPFVYMALFDKNLTSLLSNQNQWYDLPFTSGDFSTYTTQKFITVNNLTTYKTQTPRNYMFHISIVLSASANNRTIEVGLFKNGVSEVNFPVRLASANVPDNLTFSFHSNVAYNDYFQLKWRCTSNSNTTVRLWDLSTDITT